ncbi:hypothetical protein CPB86DRAFT_801030 [Serendipita vermifera]|nr:hypothetical protein CPB86DRAFT_801030 [Serendipita vermifera]
MFKNQSSLDQQRAGEAPGHSGYQCTKPLLLGDSTSGNSPLKCPDFPKCLGPSGNSRGDMVPMSDGLITNDENVSLTVYLSMESHQKPHRPASGQVIGLEYKVYPQVSPLMSLLKFADLTIELSTQGDCFLRYITSLTLEAYVDGKLLNEITLSSSKSRPGIWVFNKSLFL